MIKYKVIKPFVHKGKVYTPGSFFDENDKMGVLKYKIKNWIYMLKVEDGKVSVPSNKDVAAETMRLRSKEETKSKKETIVKIEVEAKKKQSLKKRSKK